MGEAVTPHWTASRTRLVKSCRWWVGKDAPRGEVGRAAYMGTALHALVDPAGDSAAALAALDEAEVEQVHEWFAAWKRSAWADVPWQHEVAVAYDVETDTARELGVGRGAYGDVDYSREIPGAADLIYLDAHSLTVCDIKTGFGKGAEHVSQHSQLRLLALMAARLHMRDRVTIQVLRIDGPTLEATEHAIDATELDAIAAEVRALWAAIPGAEPQPGEHCTALWCPAVTVCPATQRVVALATVAPDPSWAVTEPTTPEHALWLRDGAALLEEMAEAWKARARAYADANNGIPLPDGKVWRRTDTERETIVLDGPGGAEAEDALRRAGVEVEVKRTATKGAIEKAVAAKGLKGKALREAVEEILVPLRVAGATRTVTIPRYEAKKA